MSADERYEAIYRLYRRNPEQGRSSYLYDHYERGLRGVMRPDGELALAAWEAGRDTARAKGDEQ